MHRHVLNQLTSKRLAYSVSHEVDRISLEDLSVVSAQILVTLLGSLKGLQARVLKEKVLQLFGLLDVISKLIVVDCVAVVCVNHLVDRECVQRDALFMRHRDIHQLAEAADAVQKELHKLLAVDELRLIYIKGQEDASEFELEVAF